MSWRPLTLKGRVLPWDVGFKGGKNDVRKYIDSRKKARGGVGYHRHTYLHALVESPLVVLKRCFQDERDQILVDLNLWLDGESSPNDAITVPPL